MELKSHFPKCVSHIQNKLNSSLLLARETTWIYWWEIALVLILHSYKRHNILALLCFFFFIITECWALKKSDSLKDDALAWPSRNTMVTIPALIHEPPVIFIIANGYLSPHYSLCFTVGYSEIEFKQIHKSCYAVYAFWVVKQPVLHFQWACCSTPSTPRTALQPPLLCALVWGCRRKAYRMCHKKNPRDAHYYFIWTCACC